MDQAISVEVIRIVPSILWLVLIGALILVYRERVFREVLPNLTGVKVFGVELSFLRTQLDAAAGKQAAQLSEGDKSQVLLRAQRLAPLLRRARLLWVDDHPENNNAERKILGDFGVDIDTATSTSEAITLLHRHLYDAVISDMERDGDPTAGTELIAASRREHVYRWTIIYAASYDSSRGTPAYALGMTNRPDHLLHFVMDAIEREKN